MTSSSDTAGYAASLPLLCEFGWHRPDATPRWNNGYYFTTCARCGHDLIRTAFGKWHVPRGHRVVWQAQPPVGATSPALAERDAQPVAVDDMEQRIVREVMRQLREADAASVEPPAPQPVAEDVPPPVDSVSADVDEPPADPPAPVVRRSVIPDFIDDGWPVAPPPPAYRPTPVASDDATAQPVTTGTVSGAALDMLRGWGDDEGRKIDRRRPHNTGKWQMAAIIALFVIIVAAAAWALIERGGADDADIAAPGQSAESSPEPLATLPAFVTASTLNCRSAPTRQAPPIARLTRGMAVEAIARDGEWVSLSYAGDQCWALARYISVDRPI